MQVEKRHFRQQFQIRSKPVSKKIIIITAASGLVCFVVTFAFGWLTKPAVPSSQSTSSQITGPNEQIAAILAQHETLAGTTGNDTTNERAMTERQLKDLIYEVREKIQEYNDKLKSLEAREQRLQISQAGLKKDIGELNNLHVELVTAVANLKNERDKLEKSRVEIAQIEKANLTAIAATYDRMDPSGASKILTNMCSGQIQQPGRTTGMDDAVKILFYMTERTKARVLAELVGSEPKLVAVLVQKLKQVTEIK